MLPPMSRVAFALVVSASLHASSALAADITVGSTADDGRGCTLRDAIRTAQNAPSYAGIGGCSAGSAGADRIIVPAGTYRLTAGAFPQDEDAGAGGDLDIRESVIIDGADRATTIIDGAGRDRVFHVIGRGVRAEISGVTVQNGNAGRGDGGGIYVLEGANLVLDRAIVARSESNIGGGGVDSLGDFTITNTIIEGNRTQNDGGVRCITSCTGRLIDVIIRNNTATGNVGGGLGAAGNLYLERVQVLDNTHTGQLGAGGLSCLQASGQTHTIVVIDSLIAGNTTTGDGGGIRLGTIEGFYESDPILVVINTTIVGNRAARGAGVSVGRGRATLSSVTIADNEASGEGGGILRNTGRIELRNSVVARNRGGRGADCRGTINSAGYTLVGRATDCTVTGGSGNRVGTTASPIDARLDMGLADNGGPMRTLALLAGSPAVNAGDPAGCTDGMRALANDQRGAGFPRVVGGRCDVGAFELNTCGNGTVEAGERCDDGNTRDGDCCSAACAPTNAGMSCDDGVAGSVDDRCTTVGSCVGTSATCGDGTIDAASGETCDDGNMDDTDLCNSMCRETSCGDGVVQAARGELCDDGAVNSDTTPGACRTSCQPPSCDDGVVDPGEMCAQADAGEEPDTGDEPGPDRADGGTSGEVPADEGCGCSGVRGADATFAAVWVVVLLGLVRRRRV